MSTPRYERCGCSESCSRGCQPRRRRDAGRSCHRVRTRQRHYCGCHTVSEPAGIGTPLLMPQRRCQSSPAGDTERFDGRPKRSRRTSSVRRCEFADIGYVRELSRRKDSLRGQPHVSCRPADPRRHLRCAGGLDHGNRALTGEYRDVLGRPAHRARDARLVPHLLDTTASNESRLLGGTALRVLGRRLQSPTRPVS